MRDTILAAGRVRIDGDDIETAAARMRSDSVPEEDHVEPAEPDLLENNPLRSDGHRAVRNIHADLIELILDLVKFAEPVCQCERRIGVVLLDLPIKVFAEEIHLLIECHECGQQFAT